MECKFADLGEIRIIGKGIRMRPGNIQNHRDISAFREESRRNGFVEATEKDRGGMGLFGVCEDFDPEEESFTYFIGFEKKGTNVPNGWEETVLPPSRHAVFPVRGPMPDSVRDTWDRIYSERLPSSEYEHAGGPEFALYPNGVEHNADPKRLLYSLTSGRGKITPFPSGSGCPDSAKPVTSSRIPVIIKLNENGKLRRRHPNSTMENSRSFCGFCF